MRVLMAVKKVWSKGVASPSGRGRHTAVVGRPARCRGGTVAKAGDGCGQQMTDKEFSECVGVGCRGVPPWTPTQVLQQSAAAARDRSAGIPVTIDAYVGLI